MSTIKIYFIGEEKYIKVWKVLGCATYFVNNVDEAAEMLKKLTNEKPEIIFITENFAEKLLPLIEEINYNTSITVSILPISKASKVNKELWNRLTIKALGITLKEESQGKI